MKTFEEITDELIDKTRNMRVKEVIDYLLKNKKDIMDTEYVNNCTIRKNIFIGSGKIILEYAKDKLNIEIKSNNSEINGRYENVGIYSILSGFDVGNKRIKFEDGEFYEFKRYTKREVSQINIREFMVIINEIIMRRGIGKMITCEMLKLYSEDKISFKDLLGDNQC